MKPTLLIAIDPGKKGALSWRFISPDNQNAPNVMPLAIGAWELQTQIAALLEVAGEGCGRIAWLEEVSGFAGRPHPGSAMFAFGRAYGHAEAALAAHNFEIHKIRPQAWQKALGGLSRRGEEKRDHK